MPERSFAADAREWFHVAPIEPGLHIVAEPGHVFSWLIAGRDRSVLLDTGLGLADISAAIAPVAKGPVTAINSHVHFDHVGGNELFERVGMHELGPEWIERGTRDAYLSGYSELARGMHSAWERLRDLDRSDWFLVGPDETLREWPAERLDELGWRIDPPPPTQLLADGDTVELGDRSLRVIHTPGHAPDHICLVDEAAGILFAQDQAYYGPQLIYEEGSDLEAYAHSMRRLADELTGAIRIVYTAHCLRYSVPPRFLTELAEAAEAMAAGEVASSPMRGLFGEAVAGADFGHFSILIRPEAHE